MPAPDRGFALVAEAARDGSPILVEHPIHPSEHGRDVVALTLWFRLAPHLPDDAVWHVRPPPCPLLTALRSRDQHAPREEQAP